MNHILSHIMHMTDTKMTAIKRLLMVSALSLGLGVTMGTFAQSAVDSSTPASAQGGAMTDGEVRRIDQETGKITIKHGEIKNLDMPGMTMVFTAKSKNLLANLKVGDKIKFAVVNEAGKFIVTDIQPGQ